MPRGNNRDPNMLLIVGEKRFHFWKPHSYHKWRFRQNASIKGRRTLPKLRLPSIEIEGPQQGPQEVEPLLLFLECGAIARVHLGLGLCGPTVQGAGFGGSGFRV